MGSKTMLLIGCGQLGSRHLQALAGLAEAGEVHVVDPRLESLDVGRARLKEVADANPAARFYFHQRLEDVPCGDFCLIATQAEGRCELVKRAAALGYRKFLIEKIVAQSVGAYEDLLAFARDEGLSVWVNCKTRAYGLHRYIKSRLADGGPITFTAVAGNHGLGNNGIHEADLFVFYDGAQEIILDGHDIDPEVQASKRGPAIFDLSGMLCGHSDRGSRFLLSFAADHQAPDIITITSAQGRFIIDHAQKFAWESDPASGWQWQPITVDENWMVSHMTRMFARQILSEDSCFLPTLAECYPAHRFILEALLPHFNQRLRREMEICPVT